MLQVRGVITYIHYFKRAVLKEINQAPKALFERLFDSMPQRLQQCIEKEGQRIEY
jgi:hypothetical protein